MPLDQSLCGAQLPIVHAVILCQFDLRIKPELRLTVRTEDVDVAPRLLTREEVEPKLPLHPDRAAKRRSLESRARARGVTLAKIEPAERAAISLGRFAEPEEPASAVAFLAPAAGCHLDDIEPTRGVPMPSTRRQALRAGAHDGLSARGSASRRGLLPPGVLDILHGSDSSVGQALVAHPAIEAIALTGRIKIGAAIASVAAPRFSVA